MRPEKTEDVTSLGLLSLSKKWGNELKDAKYPSTSALTFFLKNSKAADTAGTSYVQVWPNAYEILEDGVFDFARVESARLIVDELKEMYDANLPEGGRLNITNNDKHEDKINDKIKRFFGKNGDSRWFERGSEGRKMGIIQTLKDFSGKFILGIYDREDVERIAQQTQEESFGTTYFLSTKFPNIRVAYYYIEGVDIYPEISYVINPAHP